MIRFVLLRTRAACAAAVLAFMLPAAAPAEPAAHFISFGSLVAYDGTQSRALARQAAGPASGRQLLFHNLWGTLPDGRVLATVCAPHAEDMELQSCTHAPWGGEVVLLRGDGTLDRKITDSALRVFPAPDGETVALISEDRDLSLYRNGTLTPVAAPGKVSNVGWSPDSQRLVIAVLPADWSVQAVNNALTTADFLRLKNSNLYVIDPATGRIVGQLTEGDATNYGPFFSPDGRELYYISLPVHDDSQGGLMRMTLDPAAGIRAAGPPQRLTSPGHRAGQVPLGRVGTYVWADDGETLFFEAGVMDGSGEIWVHHLPSGNARKLANGRWPQKLPSGRLAYLQTSGFPAALTIADAVREVQP